MTTHGFMKSMPLVLAHEGGYVDHPRDPGGATNLGITLATLRAYRGRPVSKDDVKRLTRKEAEAIYRKNYWQPIKGDDLPAGLDYAMFDYAVNSGVSRAVKELQRIVGTKPDGVMGVQTLAALDARPAAYLIDALCSRRLAFLKSLKTWPTFGLGWSRRVTGVRSAAKDMARGISLGVMSFGHSVSADGAAKAPTEEQRALSTPAGKEAAALGGAGVAGGVAVAAQPAADVVGVLTQQQDELTSGDVARLIVAGIIVVAVVGLALWQYRRSRARG